MARTFLLVGLVCCLGLTACVRDTSSVTSDGLGKPQLAVTFPETVGPGSTHTAELSISNPGPGRLEIIQVTFVLVGPGPNQNELPKPLILGGANENTGEIISVDPKPTAISSDELVYSFPGLDEGASIQVSFEIRVPHVTGAFANSVQVYDGRDLERLTGVRLDTLVEM